MLISLRFDQVHVEILARVWLQQHSLLVLLYRVALLRARAL